MAFFAACMGVSTTARQAHAVLLQLDDNFTQLAISHNGPSHNGPCMSIVDSLSNRWCDETCGPDAAKKPDANLCDAACDCSTAARKIKNDDRNADSKKISQQQAADPLQAASPWASSGQQQADQSQQADGPGCRVAPGDHPAGVDSLFCDLTCKQTPNSPECIASCRCPGWKKALNREKDVFAPAPIDELPASPEIPAVPEDPATIDADSEEPAPPGSDGDCTSLAETVSADYCQTTCAPTPNSDTCWEICECPGRKKTHDSPTASPLPVDSPCTTTAEQTAPQWCEQNCLTKPNSGPCLEAQCFCPGRKKDAKAAAAEAWPEPPNATEAVVKANEAALCKSTAETVSPAWCDANCAASPSADECQAVCDCPPLASPSPAPKAKKSVTECEALDPETADATWCEANCKKDPNMEWCDNSCRCPGYNETLAAERIAKRGATCSSLVDQTTGHWCDSNCAAQPNTEQCRRSCNCPNSTKLRPSPSPESAVCESLSGTASASWCDTNCLDRPEVDSCKATCKCPDAAAAKKEKKKAKKKVDPEEAARQKEAAEQAWAAAAKFAKEATLPGAALASSESSTADKKPPFLKLLQYSLLPW